MDRSMGSDPNDTIAAASSHDAGASANQAKATARWLEANLPLSLDAYEKAALERALVCSWGDAAEAARMLGIGRSTFYRKAGKHGIHLGGTRGEPSECTAPASGGESAAPAVSGRQDELAVPAALAPRAELSVRSESPPRTGPAQRS